MNAATKRILDRAISGWEFGTPKEDENCPGYWEVKFHNDAQAEMFIQSMQDDVISMTGVCKGIGSGWNPYVRYQPK